MNTNSKQEISIDKTTQTTDNHFSTKEKMGAESVLFVDLPLNKPVEKTLEIPADDLLDLQSQMKKIEDLMQNNTSSVSELSNATKIAHNQVRAIIDQLQAQGMVGAAKLIAEKYGVFVHSTKPKSATNTFDKLPPTFHI